LVDYFKKTKTDSKDSFFEDDEDEGIPRVYLYMIERDDKKSKPEKKKEVKKEDRAKKNDPISSDSDDSVDVLETKQTDFDNYKYTNISNVDRYSRNES
jgi:hypothetical protein